MSISDREFQIYVDECVPLVAKGMNLEQICRQTDLPSDTVRAILTSKGFLEKLKAYDPAAHEAYVLTKEDERIKELVRDKARADAIEHYEMLRKLARSEQMAVSSRAEILIALLKLAGQFKDSETARELVEMPPIMVETLARATAEMDGKKLADVPRVSKGKVSRVPETRKDESVLVRKSGGGEEPARTPSPYALRELPKPPSGDGGAGHKSKESGMDAKRALQEYNMLRKSALMASDPRPKHDDSAS